MHVLIFASQKVALAAVSQCLTISEYEIKSKKRFHELIKAYIQSYGELAVDDHISECPYKLVAKAIVEKYYTQF